MLLALTPTVDVGTPPGQQAEAGLYQSNSPLERVILERTTYTGDCPGDTITRLDRVTVRSNIPTCERCRVRITNNRTGGYSDREYHQARQESEDFVIGLGTRHHQQFLSLQEGINTFSFVIRQDQKPLAEGTFDLAVLVNAQQEQRSFVGRVQDIYCDDERYRSLQSRTPLSKCRYAIVTQIRGLCPSGQERVLFENRQTIWRRD